MIGDVALRIRDAEAFRICCRIWDKDGDGYITPEEAAVTREITSSTFAGNTLIESFDEFKNLSYTTSYNSLFAGCSSLKSISVNGNMIYRMFYECISLERVELGNTKNIGSEAFLGCSALKRIELPDGLTTIDASAFKGAGLVSIDIPSSVSSIGGDAFQGCPLETVIIRGYIATVGIRIFYKCTALVSFIMLSSTPMTYSYNLLQGTTCDIYVPDDSVDAYKSTAGWVGMVSRIKPLSSYTKDY